MTDQDHLIWSDARLNFADWRDELDDEFPYHTDEELYQIMYERNADALEDVRSDLSIQLTQPILVIGDLGLWYGRRIGYMELPGGNIRDCFYSDCDYNTWYVDRYGDLRCEAIHHDGVNRYLYRAYRDSATEEEIEDLKGRIYEGTATRQDIARITRRLGDEIGRVYGWDFSAPTVRRDEHER